MGSFSLLHWGIVLLVVLLLFGKGRVRSEEHTSELQSRP